MTRNCIVILCGALALSACEVPTEATPSGDVSDPLFSGHSGVVSSGSGEGEGQLPAGFSALAFEFNVRAHADGRVMGHFAQRYENSAGRSVDFAGELTCLAVDAATGRAWVGGVITRNSSTEPAVQNAIHQVGRDVWFRVVDNGEGEAAIPDRTTVFGFTGAAGFQTSADYCAGRPWAANDANTWAVISGNIQVRP